MQPDPTGPAAAASPAPDPATSPSDALATSEPTSDGLSVAEGRPDEDAAGSAPTPDDPSSVEDDGDDDGDDAEDRPDQTEEERKLSRSERRRAREAERIARAVEAEISRRESERQAREQAEAAAAKAREAAEAWQREFGQIVGAPEVRKALTDEIETLIQTTISVDPETADYAELQRLTEAQKALAAKRQQLAEYDRNLQTYQKLDEFHFRNTQHEFAARGASLPEAYRQKYLQARTVPEALAILEDGLVAREAAKAKAEVERVTAEWRSRYEKEVAAHAATRTGAPGAGPAPEAGGRSGGVSGGLPQTLDQFRDLPSEQRQKLRRTHSDYVNELYRRAG